MMYKFSIPIKNFCIPLSKLTNSPFFFLAPSWIDFGSMLRPFLAPCWIDFGTLLESIVGLPLGPFWIPFWEVPPAEGPPPRGVEKGIQTLS